MTVAGFAKSADGFAFAWADVETYLDGSPAGEARKLGVSRGGGVVGVGCGDKALVEHFVGGVEWATRGSFECLTGLRAEVVDMVGRKRARFGHSRQKSTLAAVGFEAGRFVGVVMREATGFEPEETEAWRSPDVDASPPGSAHDVFAISLEQMKIVRREIPLATGRALEIAKIGPRGVERVRVPLLVGDFD